MMIFKNIICWMLFTSVGFGFAQFSEGDSLWKVLAKVEWTSRYEPLYGTEVDVPQFSMEVLALDGAEIEISGFVMPVDFENNQMIISALPFASCFFCGKAGPETVMDTDIKRQRSWINRKIKLTGKLRINKEDVLGLVYSLEDTKVIGFEE